VTVTEFTLAVVTREAVWLRPGYRRRTKVSWELLEDLADPTLPANRWNPAQTTIYARLLAEARAAPCAPPAQKRRAAAQQPHAEPSIAAVAPVQPDS
jgi:hypothetical protein